MNERLFLGLHGGLLLAPGASAPAGGVRELDVPREIVEHVAHVAVYREADVRVPIERVVPDGAVRLVFDLGTRRGRVDVAGPSTAPVLLPLGAEIANLTVTLRPEAAGEVLGVSAAAIRDRCVPLEDVWPGDVSLLFERLAGAPDDGSFWDVVRSVLVKRRARGRASDRGRARRAQRVLAAGGDVREAAAALGIGERRLEQIFQAEVGLSPRLYRRLARVGACLRTLSGRSHPHWSDLAAERGYFDQAHLSNDFTRLVGLTPSELFARISGSSKTDR